ncbi:GNAT family N-acetyltransferase [Burkholderia guangdongensis]|uniref:GNAT family N-acetyltransferase n=1 Tax=Burkholderia guangdongensis TaxID=1792500 RepID=UPI0015C75508|nr:GNAT family N-acetyltransferase [Burkholderia guangdongensis]
MDTIAIEGSRASATAPDALAETVRHVWHAKDGTPVLVRAIEPDDFAIERDFVCGLSKESGYMRLMSGREPTADEMVRWTHIDWRREGAVIAAVRLDGRERQIGVARYAMNDGEFDTAEFAIVISDAWHGRGLGGELLSSLIDLAARSGVKRLFGTTLSENHAMIGLARRFGFTAYHERGAAFITELTLDLHSRSPAAAS